MSTHSDEKLIYDSKKIFQLSQELLMLGYKNKELAKALGIYPSAFSTFLNRVMKHIAAIHPSDRDRSQKIQGIFKKVNNISEVKTRQRLPRYLEKIEALKLQTKDGDLRKSTSYIECLVNTSPPDIMKMMEGIYDVYYLSSFGYRIKREPFLVMHHSQQDAFVVRKGNGLGPAKYEGFGYVSNNHLFTVQLKECDTLIPDNFIAHFQLPPAYTSALNMFKGIAVSMSNSYLPIARKVVLHRISSKPAVEDFNAIRTVFFEEGDGQNNDIVRYLRSQESCMEYLPIPYPSYDTNDLLKEEKVKDLIS